jgi:cAMP-dependent protein kinase regulator
VRGLAGLAALHCSSVCGGDGQVERREAVRAEPVSTDHTQLESVVSQKDEASRTFLRDVLCHCPALGALQPRQVEMIIDAMAPVDVAAGGRLEAVGQFTVVRTGTCVVDGRDWFTTAGYFGEAHLANPRAQQLTVSCKSATTLFTLERRTYRQIIVATTADRKQLYEKVLGTVKLLQEVPPSHFSALADNLEPVYYADGQVVMTQGEAGDYFYLVVEGSVSVTVDGAELARRGCGDYIGARAG